MGVVRREWGQTASAKALGWDGEDHGVGGSSKAVE